MKLKLTINGREFPATLEDNAATQEFAQQLPIALRMDELNGNEKYCYLDDPLPTDAMRPGTISVGDLMLYGSSCLVVFYDSFPTSYSYTRLGRIDDPSGLARAMGSGSAEVVWELA